MTRALIIGATSSLAQSLCRQLAAQGTELILAGRSEEELARLAMDLSIRYRVPTQIYLLDLAAQNLDFPSWAAGCGEIDTVIVAAGDMGGVDKNDMANIERTIAVNFTAPARLLSAFALLMQQRGSGQLVVIGSVAGDRGRQSNYIYGSAKAGLATFAAGLRNRLARDGVHVLTVKPGFIDTPLTYAMASPLTADRDYAAKAILGALRQRRNVLYVPWFWRWIMLIIRCIPEGVFKRMKL